MTAIPKRRLNQPHAAIVSDLGLLAKAPNPDAEILRACDEHATSYDSARAAYRAGGPGKAYRLRPMLDRQREIEAELAKMRARTAAGRRAKAEVVLARFHACPHYALVRSVLLEFIAASSDA